ncbi:MAG: DMT family transporter [Ectothiorhodospiraceae bacterium]|nr:DMT family transporter [Chromatiales bacterium]MCP5153544.1 DMT family transporter [Ectothiorhodospiraceae bacterium]
MAVARAVTCALAGYGVFALHDALIKSLVGYSVFQIVFFAVLFSYVPFSFSLAADPQQRNLRPVHPGWVMLRTGCMVASIALAFFAFRSLPLSETYALLFATPLLITVLAIPILGEKVRLFRWLVIGLGTIGVLIVLRPGVEALKPGHVAALLAVCCSALSSVTTRRIGSVERAATLMIYPLLANIVFSGSLLWFVYVPMPFLDLAKTAAIGALAMAGQWLIISAYRAAPAAFVAPFQYSQMIWAVIYGTLWFGETPDRHVYLGAAVIILSGLLIVWRESRSGVSINRPFLRTRNVRALSAAPMRPSESDEPRMSGDDAPPDSRTPSRRRSTGRSTAPPPG